MWPSVGKLIFVSGACVVFGNNGKGNRLRTFTKLMIECYTKSP